MIKPENVKLEGVKRETGKGSTAKLRNEKRVPAVLYGPGMDENISLHVDELELEKILSRSQTKLQDLTIDGKSYHTLLKRVEFDPVTDRPLHADFYLLEDGKQVSLRIPIRLQGAAKGVVDGGGRVFQPMRIVRVKAIPEAIPAQFDVDITPLDIGDSIHVSELDMEGITLLDDPERTIVTISPPKSEALFTTTVPETDEDVEGEEMEEGAEEMEEEGTEEETTEE
ncbi:MAG: 50S ribosomal protein L25 [Balneolaceae bacterium]